MYSECVHPPPPRSDADTEVSSSKRRRGDPAAAAPAQQPPLAPSAAATDAVGGGVDHEDLRARIASRSKKFGPLDGTAGGSGGAGDKPNAAADASEDAGAAHKTSRSRSGRKH